MQRRSELQRQGQRDATLWAYEAGLSVVSNHKPPLIFIDANGMIHREDTRSAEELIEAWHDHH